VTEPTESQARWVFDGVAYKVVAASDVATRDGYGYELWELGASGRGMVLEAFWDDTTGLFTFTALTQEPLPFRLVEQFVQSASAGVPPSR
jgi:hypothetical protein